MLRRCPSFSGTLFTIRVGNRRRLHARSCCHVASVVATISGVLTGQSPTLLGEQRLCNSPAGLSGQNTTIHWKQMRKSGRTDVCLLFLSYVPQEGWQLLRLKPGNGSHGVPPRSPRRATRRTIPPPDCKLCVAHPPATAGRRGYARFVKRAQPTRFSRVCIMRGCYRPSWGT